MYILRNRHKKWMKTLTFIGTPLYWAKWGIYPASFFTAKYYLNYVLLFKKSLKKRKKMSLKKRKSNYDKKV